MPFEDEFLRMEAAVKYALNGIALADMNGILNYVNDAFIRLWGYTDASEILGRSALSFWESREQALEVLARVRKEGTWSGVMSGLRKDGARFTSQVSTSLFTDSGGRLAGIMASFWDLKAEELLKEHEKRYRELVARISSGVAVYEAVDGGRDFIFKDINPAGGHISKVRREDIIGRSLLTVFPGAQEIGLFRALQRVWNTGNAEHLPAVLYQDGRISHWTENHLYKLPSNEIVAVYDDVTEQKHLEESLRTVALAVEHSSDAIGMSTPEGMHYYQNKAFTDLFGEVGEHPLQTELENTFLGREIMDTVKAGTPWRGELKSRDKNKDPIDILMRAYAIKDNSGSIQGLVGLITDITAQKRAESELHEIRQLLEAALAQLPLGVLIVKGPDISVQFVNQTFLVLHAIDPQDSEGIHALKAYTAWQAYRPDGSPYPFEELPLCRALTHGKTTCDEQHVIRDMQGVKRWITVNAAPIRDKEGNIISAIVLIEDISKRKEAEEEQTGLRARLAQAEKMESVGRLAGGVAHDFNNMLMVIGGYTEMALQDLGPDHPVRMAMNEIHQAVARAAEITRQLLAFTRKQPRNPRPLDLNEVIEDLLKMLRRLIGEHIELVWTAKEDLWTAYIDPSQVNQLLVNLCVNARDAIQGNGRITVETGNITLDETYCTSHEGFFPGEFVCFVVTDTGMGMDEITRKSIFEPFFTTKEADKGTGLGMATVYGIVKQNNGFINIYSEPGLGTSVRIFLPRHAGAKERVQEQQQVRIPEGAGETVLFVEDEPSILKMGRRLLGRLGYNVLATCSPGEAIRLARDHENKIHLLVSDMIMPEMNGQELARHIQELFPKCGVLYMSGYTAETITRQGILNEGVHFIQKPFSVDQFAKKVREIIDEMSGVPAE